MTTWAPPQGDSNPFNRLSEVAGNRGVISILDEFLIGQQIGKRTKEQIILVGAQSFPH